MTIVWNGHLTIEIITRNSPPLVLCRTRGGLKGQLQSGSGEASGFSLPRMVAAEVSAPQA